MRLWYGQFLGFIAGWLLLRHPVGGFLGLLVGYAFDHDAFSRPRARRPGDKAPLRHDTGNADVDWAYRVFGLPEDASDAQIDRAHRLAARLRVGMVWINTWLMRDLRTPFGGVGQSGLGREGGFEAMRFFTEPKNVGIALQ